MLLDVADEGIGGKLKDFEGEQATHPNPSPSPSPIALALTGARGPVGEQATGEKLNEVTEKYFKQYPRDFDAPWPSEEPKDIKLR